MNLRLLPLVLLLVLPPGASAADPLLDKFLKRYTGWQDMCATLDMKVEAPGGSKREGRSKVCQLRDASGQYGSVEVEAPLGARGTVLLSQQLADGSLKQWMYMPANKRAMALQVGGAERPFLGTDFSTTDLALNLQDPATLKPAGEGKCGAAACRAYETQPRGSEARRQLWLLDSGALHHVDVIAGGKTVKRLEIGAESASPEGYWIPKTAVMHDLRSGSKTTASYSGGKFNQKLDRALFDAEQRWGTGAGRPR